MFSDDTDLPIRAVNSGPGSLPVHNAPGDQNVNAGSNGVINIYHQGTYSALPMTREVAHLTGEDSLSLTAAIDWLAQQCKVEYRAHCTSLLDQIVPGTGEWASKTEAFGAWKAGSCRLLWMHGVVGSGKTMLAALIAESLRTKIRQSEDREACIFACFGDDAECQPSLSGIFAHVLMQLLQQKKDPSLRTELREKCKYGSYQDAILTAEFLKLFKGEAAEFQTVYLVFDGLDHYEDSKNRGESKSLLQTLQQLPPTVRLLVTCRSAPISECNMDGEEELEVRAHPDDIAAYVERHINDSDTLGGLIAQDSDPEFRKSVVTEVTNATEGIFLLAKRYMARLCEQPTLGNLKEVLKMLPDTIVDTFQALVRRIKKGSGAASEWSVAEHVLVWILLSQRELTANELRHSFALKFGCRTLDHKYLPPQHTLTSACPGLVALNGRTGVLSFVHKSVGTHLRHASFVSGDAEEVLAKKCLTYLLFDDFAETVSTEEEVFDRITRFPLATYAASNWVAHLDRAQNEDASLDTLVLTFLNDPSKVTNAFQIMHHPQDAPHGGITGLHAAAFFGRVPWLEYVMATGNSNIDTLSLMGQTALHWAAKYGKDAVVESLLAQSTAPSIQDMNGDTPLHLAVTSEHTRAMESIVKQLIHTGAPVDVHNLSGLTPASSIIQRKGPTAVARILVRNYPDINAEDAQGSTLLRETMECGLVAVMEELLARGADLNHTYMDGWTPLGHAARVGDESVIRTLLDYGAEINAQGAGGGISPLRCAVIHKHEKIVRLLIEKGADVNDVDTDQFTLLIHAVQDTSRSITWLLVESGARVDDQDEAGWTALHHAVIKADRSMTWLLVTKGADLEIRDNYGLSALDYAVWNGDLSIIWLLVVEGKVQVDAPGIQGLTALHRASSLGLEDAAGFLIDRGAGVHTTDEGGLTALHHAVKNAKGSVAKGVLLRKGASCNAQDSRGLTPLHYAASQASETSHRLVSLLAEEGARPDLPDEIGRTALHYAAKEGNINSVEKLKELEASLDAQDSELTTPLMLSAQEGKLLAAYFLLTQGADPYLRDKHGRTARDYAAHAGRNNGVGPLIDIMTGPFPRDAPAGEEPPFSTTPKP